MNFSKLLLAVVALGATAKVSTFVGAGASIAMSYPNGKSGEKLFDTYGVTADGDTFEADGDKSIKFKSSSVKGFNPAGLFLTGALTFDEFAGALSLGFGLDVGYRWNFGLPTDSIYGKSSAYVAAATTDAGATAADQYGFTITYPDGAFFIVPKVLIGADIMDMHILFSLGLDMSQNKYNLKYATKTDQNDSSLLPNANISTDASAWLFGIKAGLEAIFQIGPCTGLGVGLHLTYWPETWNDVKEEGVAKKFNPALDKDAKVWNFGGSWSVTGSATAHFAFG